MRTCQVFPTAAAKFYISTSNVWWFQFLHILIDTCYCPFLEFIASLEEVKWYLTVALSCISIMTNDVEHPFMSLLAICISSLEKCLSKSSAVFNWVICHFVESWVPHIFWIQVIWYMICIYFLPFCGLSFHFLDDILCGIEGFNFNFDNVQFIFSFVAYNLEVIYKKKLLI